MSRFKWLEFDDPKAPKPVGAGAPKPPDEDRDAPGVDMADPRQVLQIADEHYRKLDYEKALKFYSKTLGLDPNVEAAWAGQLRCLLDLGENPEALTWATKAQKLFPKNADVISARALALARVGNIPEAIAFSDGAMKHEKVGWFFWVARGEILALSGSSNAEFCMVKGRESAPNDWMVLLKVAEAYSRVSQPEKAVPLFKKVLSVQPDLAEVWYEQGKIQMELGFTGEAAFSFEKAQKLSPHNHKYSRAMNETANMGTSEKIFGWLKSLIKGVFKG